MSYSNRTSKVPVFEKRRKFHASLDSKLAITCSSKLFDLQRKYTRRLVSVTLIITRILQSYRLSINDS